MDLITRRKSALNNNNGTAKGSKNSNTILYAGDSHEIIPKLLAARPTKVLTSAPLNALPIWVRSDLQISFEKQSQQQPNALNKSFRDIRVENYQIPNAPVAKRAVHVPHLSWGEMRGKFNWDLTVTLRVVESGVELGKSGERNALLLFKDNDDDEEEDVD